MQLDRDSTFHARSSKRVDSMLVLYGMIMALERTEELRGVGVGLTLTYGHTIARPRLDASKPTGSRAASSRKQQIALSS